MASMSDEVSTDVSTELGAQGSDTAELERLDHITEVLDMVYLSTQDETGNAGDAEAVYEVDSTQWEALITRLDSMHDVMSMALFLDLVILCGVGALLGGQLWRVFSEGFRR